MRQIFKTGFGFHIDLAAIVAISELSKFGDGEVYFTIDLQLCDKPKKVGCRERWTDEYFERTYRPDVINFKSIPPDELQATIDRYTSHYENYQRRVRSDWQALFDAWKNS